MMTDKGTAGSVCSCFIVIDNMRRTYSVDVYFKELLTVKIYDVLYYNWIGEEEEHAGWWLLAR